MSDGNIKKVIDHIHQRFNELDSYLDKHTNAIVTIYGENGVNRLLSLQARKEWIKLDPRLNNKIQIELDKHVDKLMNKFNGRITIHNVNEPINTDHIIVFGTNESDWNQPNGHMISSIHMNQKPGMYGIVTMPTINVENLKVNPISWNNDEFQFLTLLKVINDNQAHNQPAHNQPYHNQPAHNQPAHHQPAHQPAHHQQAHHQPAHHQPAHHQPAHNQPAHHQRVHRKVHKRSKSQKKSKTKKVTKSQCKKNHKKWVTSHKIRRNGKNINVKGYCRSK
jgi:hypothetical protein